MIDELTVTEPADERTAVGPTWARITFVTSFTRKEPVAENRLDSDDNALPKRPEGFAWLELDWKYDRGDLLRNLGWLPIPEETDRLSDEVNVAVMLIPELLIVSGVRVCWVPDM